MKYGIILSFVFSMVVSLSAFSREGGYEPYWTEVRPEGFDPPQEIIASGVRSGPAIDGVGSDDVWNAARAEIIHLSGNSGERDVTVRALYTDSHIYFLIRWWDETPNIYHRRWIWDGSSYREDEVYEDALILRFSVGCDFVSSLDAGIAYDADLWYWGSMRTNPAGRAADMLLLVHFQGGKDTDTNRKKVYEFTPGSLEPFWRIHQGWEGSSSPMYALEKPREKVFAIVRSDRGDLPYRRVEKPLSRVGDSVDQFVPQTPTGSSADIEAMGIWKDGYWTVELGRRRVTEYQGDDWDVEPLVTMSISILDGREFPEESVSRVIFYRLDGQEHDQTE